MSVNCMLQVRIFKAWVSLDGSYFPNGRQKLKTLESLRQALYRAHYQVLFSQNDIVPNPDISSPENYGWRIDSGRYVPVSSVLPAAPDAVVQLVRCSCSKSKCSSSCSCRRNNMNCTEMCECEGDLDVCSNVYLRNADYVFEELDSILI